MADTALEVILRYYEAFYPVPVAAQERVAEARSEVGAIRRERDALREALRRVINNEGACNDGDVIGKTCLDRYTAPECWCGYCVARRALEGK